MSSAEVHSDSPVEEVSEHPVGLMPAVQSGRAEEKLLTLLQFVPFSVESTPSTKLDARLARLQLEKEEQDREFQLRNKRARN